ncbi:dicarboxylate symporter family domain protein [Burkholderia mallei]|nr:dicarboxylate symporter family domain protein [Burkholderia mallei]
MHRVCASCRPSPASIVWCVPYRKAREQLRFPVHCLHAGEPRRHSQHLPRNLDSS